MNLRDKKPTIKKVKGGWLFTNHDTILFGNSKSDREFMIYMIKKWRKQNEQI